jgi:hypothetical protein
VRKALDVISVLAFIVSVSLGAGALFTYRWATSPKTHEMLKQKALSAVSSSLPVPGGLTGPAIPTKIPGSPTGLGLPDF